MAAPATRRVVAALTAGGADARFVGGCVRDAVVGRAVKDVDIATHAAPDEVMRMLKAAGLKAIPTGIEHGTITAVVDHGHYEITTLRRDVETDGRRAKVEFTDDWKADAARRDFTMNAMFCAPDGTLYDPFGGMADLACGRVRFVGNARKRITEDVLRLLRFFRFQAHYGRGMPDPEALDACKAMADRLPTLSGERVRAELLRLLEAPDPATVWRLMQALEVTPHLLPVPADPERLHRLTDIQAAFAIPPADDPLLRLASLLVTDKAGALAVAERIRLSNAERDRLVTLVAPPIPVTVNDGHRHRIKALYTLGPDAYLDLVMLAGARGDAPIDPEVFMPALEAASEWQGTAFPLKGRDLIELGMPPGPRLGDLLDEVEAWWVESECRPDKEACLEEALRRV